MKKWDADTEFRKVFLWSNLGGLQRKDEEAEMLNNQGGKFNS
jgi:hypothetical protein